jgi:rod shape-determining protein MreC
MKDLLNKKVIVAGIATLLLLAVMAVISVVRDGAASPVANAVGVLTSPFRVAVSKIVGFTDRIYGYIYEFDELKAENAELKASIAEMEQQVRDSQSMIAENERLRELLGLSDKHRDFDFVMTEIVSWDSSNWASSFMIDKGSADGIAPYNCVIDAEGNLAGYISEVGTNWASVTTLIDSAAEMGALVYRTRASGVAEGDFTLMNKGLLKLTYFDNDTVLLLLHML